ncbi:hypothetical protein JQN58_15610 [Aneurinibacillus sp. BA2021]|nr:hypothetical protein [Aneurinibacillus sp. BA2021]
MVEVVEEALEQFLQQHSQRIKQVVQEVEGGGRILGIEVLDHVIVNASGGYVSFKEKNYL